MKVREFWLTNANGIKYSLNQKKTFAYEPEGLGYAVDVNVVRLGFSNLITSESYNLPSFTSELVFISDRLTAYQHYKEFVSFLSKRPITLHYMPPNSNESYQCACRVTELTKTEYLTDNYMSCPITIYRQSMWYDDKEHIIDAYNTQEEGKQYPLKRPYHYGIVSTQNISIYNDGMVDAPMKVEVFGESTDPMLSVFDDQNNKYGAAKIIGTYDYVAINSDDIEEGITLERNGSTIPNAVNYQDLTVGDPRSVYVTFLKLKPGQSTLVFSLDNSFSGYVRITWRNAYVTV